MLTLGPAAALPRSVLLLWTLLPWGPLSAQRAPAGPDPAGDAFLDPAARTLVERVRQRRSRLRTDLRSYEVAVQDRMSVHLRILGPERTVYRCESAAAVYWSPDSVVVRLAGGRRLDATGGVRPQGADGCLIASVGGRSTQGRPKQSLAYEPTDLGLLFGLVADSGLVLDPFAPGAEANYRYASGDALRVHLAGREEIRLSELRVTPRRTSDRLMRGSLFMDSETYDLAHALIQIPRTYVLRCRVARARGDVNLNCGDASRGGSQGVAVPGLDPLRLRLEYASVRYGLWEGRFWLPASIAAVATAEFPGPALLEMRYERRYGEYRVGGRDGEAGDISAPRGHGQVPSPGPRPPSYRLVRPSDALELMGSEALPGSRGPGSRSRSRTKPRPSSWIGLEGSRPRSWLDSPP